jgi:hypothetical protein
MASYMTTMFQIARSIFQSKPISVTEVKEVSKPEDAMKNTTEVKDISAPVQIMSVNAVKDISAPVEIISVQETMKDISVPVEIISVPETMKHLSVPVEIISVPDTLKDMAVKDTNDVKENLIPAEDVSVTAKESNIVPENVETEIEKPVKAVDSAPKRKPRGKPVKK